MSARSGGSTLLQVTMLIAVVATMAGAAMPLVLRALEQAEEHAVEDQLSRLEHDLLEFYRVHGRFPKKSEFPAATDPRGGVVRYRRTGKVAILEPRGFPGIERQVSPASVEARWLERTLGELEVLRPAILRYEASRQALPKNVGVLATDYLGSDYLSDPWGRPYRIDRSARTVTSDGPDRKRRTTDDLVRSLE